MKTRWIERASTQQHRANRPGRRFIAAACLCLVSSAVPRFAAADKPVAAESGNVVTRVDVDATSDGRAPRITIEGTQPFTPQVQAINSPMATVITLPGRWEAGRSGSRTVQHGGVASVRSGQFCNRPECLVRIVAKTDRVLPCRLLCSVDRRSWTVILGSDADAPKTATPDAEDASPLAPISRLAPADHGPLVAAPPAKSSAPVVAPNGSAGENAAPPARLVAPERAYSHVVSHLTAQAGAPGFPAAANLREAAVTAPAHAASIGTAPINAASSTMTSSSGAHVKSTAERLAAFVTLDFVDADIKDVIKAISLQSGINIVTAADVHGNVTISVKRVSVRDSLDMVARLSGYRYVMAGSTFVVGTGASIAAFSRDASIQTVSTAAIPFTFSDSAKLLDSVKAAFPNINVSLVLVGSDAPTVYEDSSSQSTAPQRLAGASSTPNRGSAVDPSVDPGVLAADASGHLATAQVRKAAVAARGGVLNVVGSADEVTAVQDFVKATESALLASGERGAENAADVASRQAQSLSQLYASYITETYKVRYCAPQDLVKLLGHLVPTLNIFYGPVQGFTTGSSGASATYSQPQGGNGGGDGGASGGASSNSGGSQTSAAASGAASGGGGGTGSAGSASHAKVPNTLLLNGTPQDVARARTLLDQIDVSVPQLEFEARVVDVEISNSRQLGLNYDFSQTVNVGEVQPSTGANGTGATQTIVDGTNSGLARNLGFGAIYRTPYAVNVQLQALENNNHARTLASPNLSALDGEPATAFIGDQIQYVSSETQGTNGPNITTDTASVGITLKVTGKASPDGTITLYVHPEVSVISSYLTLSNGISLPQISTRYVDTTIRVKNGETIAIGGLIQDQDVKNIQKVPFLGDLPFFGQLFRSNSTTKDRTNILIFITSHVLKD